MEKHVPAETRILERFERFGVNSMSRSFFDQLPGHVPLDFHVPAGMPEIEHCRNTNVPACPGRVPPSP